MDLLLTGMLISVAILAFYEMRISGSWKESYFRTGLVLFRKSFTFGTPKRVSPRDLEERFNGGVSVPMLFRALNPEETAFREKPFGFSLFHYTPVMHGLIRVDETSREVSVTGFANWFTFAIATLFAVAFFGGSIHVQGVEYFVVGILLPMLFASLYAIQYVRYRRIFNYLRERFLNEMQSQPESYRINNE